MEVPIRWMPVSSISKTEPLVTELAAAKSLLIFICRWCGVKG